MGQEEVLQFLTTHKGETFCAADIIKHVDAHKNNVYDSLHRLEKSKLIYSYFTVEKGRTLKLYYVDDQPKKSTFSEVYKEYLAIREMHRSIPGDIVSSLLMVTELRKRK